MGRQYLDAGRRQLNRQREAIELAADLHHGRGVGRGQREGGIDRSRLAQEQRDDRTMHKLIDRRKARRVGDGEGGETIFLLAPDLERRPARHQRAHLGTGREEVDDDRRDRRDLLDVIQQQQHPPRPQIGVDALTERPSAVVAHVERPRDGWHNEARVTLAGEHDHAHAVTVLPRHRGRHVQRQTRLANPGWPGERHEARVLATQHILNPRRIARSPEERREYCRQGVRVIAHRRGQARARTRSPLLGGGGEGDAVVGRERERVSEQADRVPLWRMLDAALHVADVAHANRRALGQPLLRQACGEPVVAEEPSEARWSRPVRVSIHLSAPIHDTPVRASPPARRIEPTTLSLSVVMIARGDRRFCSFCCSFCCRYRCRLCLVRPPRTRQTEE